MATYVNKRTAHRGRLLALMLMGLLCAFGSFWLLQVMSGGEETQAGVASTEPDYIIDNFSFVRMSEHGQPRYVLSGARLTHRPVDDVSEIEKPVMHSLTTQHPPMTVTANHARVLHAKDQVDLIGDVDVVRPETPKYKPLRMRTEELTLLPDDEIMKTDKHVTLTLGGMSVSGTGMVANNATQQVHLDSQSHIELPPRDKR
ncbi:LPS export ABC transporter periplasmic protein LptC [Massilia horti]|uniref:LPS export ABC transporter periplasmic protein LptC n=1 Tax=Massilia horti TaxID=2562153 RepID=A0A4Y9SZV7_9BURK|nr:LPS export ABC transporter periplasmic protein LptC [Massilia horti]